MKKYTLLSGILFLALGCQSTQTVSEKTFKTEYGAYLSPGSAAAVEATTRSARVLLIPQWHFSPQVDTKTQSVKQPQFENQFSIFKHLQTQADLKKWIVEGCEGEIKKGFPLKFNGWSLSDVETQLKSEGNIDLVMTHIGLKGEALMQDKLQVICGDSLELVQKHLLILSDIRAYIGYKIRIEQYKNQPSLKASYIESLRKALKLSVTSTESEVQKKLDTEIQSAFKSFKNLIYERNRYFMKAIMSLAPNDRAALIIGALHISDLEAQLKKQNIKYIVFKPNGLDAAGGDPLIELQKILN